MDHQSITFSAQRLAHVVLMSFKDESRTRSWLEANKISSPSNDRVINLAMDIVRDTLEDKHFSLKDYKSKHSKTCNR